MDTIRLFLRSSSFRDSKRKKNTTADYSRTISTTDETNDSNNNFSIDMDDGQSSSNEKLSRHNIQSLLTNSTSTSFGSHLSVPRLDPETYSGLSTASSENLMSTTVAASASESVSNANSFTNHDPSKRRRSLHRSEKRRRSRIIIEPDFSQTSSLSLPLVRRIKSRRHPERIRRHSIKLKHSQHHTQPFQTTYRQRYEEFRKLFKELPDTERLIVDYSCAWQKDILVQGRMYLSQNYLCFYANILNWKTILCLKFEDIVGITREKTAKVISNAIAVKTNKTEKYFFASFVTRDKTYTIMYRIWQAVKDNQPISSQQLWTMIHESYGDDLDMTTDEEDTYHKSLLNSPSDKMSSKSYTPTSDKYDLSNIVLRIRPNSVLSSTFQHEDDRSSVSSRGEHQSDDESINQTGEEARNNTRIHRSKSNSMEQDINKTTKIHYLTTCPCDSHLATELINRTYSMSVEHLFDCIFGDNDFLVAYRASRRIKDFRSAEWQVNAETGKRERLYTFKVDVNAVFGSTTISSKEKQMIESEVPKSYYIIDTEVRNEGIKYADTFYVASRYCLVQTGPNKSHLRVTCDVKYVKSLMAIIKTFIEKNAMAALQDSFTDLMKRIDQESSKKPRTLSISNKNNEREILVQSPSVISPRRLSRQQQENELPSSINNLSVRLHDEQPIQNQTSSDVAVVTSNPSLTSRNTFLIPFCLIIMLLLLIVNIFLCMKLNQIDQITDRLVQSYPAWLNKYSYQQEDNVWSLLLKKQEEYYQIQLQSLQSILTTTHNALRNVTDTLSQLAKLNSGSS
ncbi:unnamed protein product [Adineta steineri]|uniref:VASt domain-containing protein n=2 Tax=Adineta steineri TaxID=433720 RepID=A0A814JIH8_9BILA|nr:unnamed protein product [Adineta steineri]CAF1265722.1 unnamed protein product [Adineta steineri]CAF1320520.1 unnamed protein product [Adineta steineri]